MKQLPRDVRSVHTVCGKLKDQPHHFRGLRVRLHASVRAFPIPIRTYLALILAALHLGIFGALGLDGHVAAVVFVYQIFERDVHAARVTFEAITVKFVAERNKARMKQREHTLDEIAGFDAVAPETGKVLDDDAVDLVLPHHLDEFLDLGPLKVCTGVPIVHELDDLRVCRLWHGGGVFMENKALVFDAQAVVLAVL